MFAAVCVRGMTAEAEAYLKEGSVKQTLSELFAGLDALGATPWRVNKVVLGHLVHAWNTGKPIGGLPPDIPTKPEDPPKPDDYDINPFARYKWHKDKQKEIQKFYDAKSLRATENYKLEIANAVRFVHI